MADETTPLLSDEQGFSSDPYQQFCLLVGVPPSDKPGHPSPSDQSLYGRVFRKRKSQNRTYTFTAALSNTLLLSQVVLGATLTALGAISLSQKVVCSALIILGASESSHVLITIFGVCNTVIAGLVAYLKSRGQPMRARVFRDDLEHVVDEIENSKTMWLGVQNRVLGYDEIDVDDKVSIRSEVARLTRLYESAIKKYMQNNPDLYNTAGGALDPITGLKARPGRSAQLPPTAATPDPGATSAGAPPTAAASPPADDADDSPATAKNSAKFKKSAEESPADAKDEGQAENKGKDKEEAVEGAHGNEPSDAKEDGADAAAVASSKVEDVDADAEPASTADPSKKNDAPKDPGDAVHADAKKDNA
ncbi:MAG: hypothetical protein LQ342_008164 [Letrouitia transgressa]|nr:MAG: hypothetical protein LQ342_008164 [Letrouitia transgressa]